MQEQQRDGVVVPTSTAGILYRSYEQRLWADQPGLTSWHHHHLLLCDWVSHFTALNSGLFTCKIGLTIPILKYKNHAQWVKTVILCHMVCTPQRVANDSGFIQEARLTQERRSWYIHLVGSSPFGELVDLVLSLTKIMVSGIRGF